MSFGPPVPPRPGDDPGAKKERQVQVTSEKKDGIHITTDRLIGIIVLIAGAFVTFFIVNGEQKTAMKKDIEALQESVKELKFKQTTIEAENRVRLDKLHDKVTEIREIVVKLETKSK